MASSAAGRSLARTPAAATAWRSRPTLAAATASAARFSSSLRHTPNRTTVTTRSWQRRSNPAGSLLKRVSEAPAVRSRRSAEIVAVVAVEVLQSRFDRVQAGADLVEPGRDRVGSAALEAPAGRFDER